MAIKDPNVFNRINTLNTNLENANIAEIQRNISNRLFGVLDWANNISIDSELYASINNVANATDMANYINTAKTNLPNTHVSIPYAWWAFAVPNSVVTLTAAAWIADTQNAITNVNNAINWLNNLPGQINTLRARLDENRRILNDIHNIQLDWRWSGRRVADINNDITTETSNRNICNNLLNILSRIQTVEQHAAYSNPAHPQHAYYQTLHTNEVNNFNATIAGITWVTNYAVDWDFVIRRTEVTTAQTTYDNDIRNLQQELRLSEETLQAENRLQTSNIPVPNGFGLFNTNDTRVNKATLTNAANTQAQIDNIDSRLEQLNILGWQIETLRARYQDVLNRLNRILALQNLQQRLNTTYPWEMNRRQHEFNTIREISHNNLWLWEWAPGTYEPYLPNNTIRVGEVWIWWNPARVVNLDFIDWALWTWFNGWARNFRYSLCDNNWNPLRNNWWRVEVQLGSWQTINIWGITFDNATQTMNMDNIEINPIEWITFPLSLDLNVMVRIHDDDTWLDIDHHKPIHLEITRPTLAQTDREHAYDTLVPPMNDRIQAEYSDHYRENLENEAIWNILREWWNEAEVNEIYNNETRRNLFIDRIRTRLAWNIPLFTLVDLQTWFRADIIRENRDVPVQYLLDRNTFQNYVRQSIPDNLRTYALDRISNNANTHHRDDILQEFIDFQADIANNRVDNDDNMRALAQVPLDNDWPQWHPNTFFQRLRRDRNIKNNYTKFFQWRDAEFNNLSLETEDWTINYSVHVEVPWVNKIVATINIEWKEEPEIIEASSHDRLIRWILTRGGTKDWEPLNRKLRCNIALSVLKAMVAMSPQRLNRQIPVHAFRDNRWNNVNCDRVEAYVRWWNLRIRASNQARQNVTIFDEEQFKNIHDVDMLENWIHDLSTQINIIMNATAQEYDEATSAMERNIRNRYVMQYNTAQRLRGGPIKRLRWRMVHGRTNYDFDFDTAVNEAWKSVNISLNKWLFTVSWEFDWQQYEYRSRNLWSILREKINRKRVFDWIELAMLAAINENFIQRLRENHWVQTENFVISDSNLGKTWRTYIFDDSWDLSYMEIEDNNLNPLWAGQSGRIDPAQVPTHRVRCNEAERREFMQNPLLAWRLQREMRRRLAMF